jgi:hypothetical protein
VGQKEANTVKNEAVAWHLDLRFDNILPGEMA